MWRRSAGCTKTPAENELPSCDGAIPIRLSCLSQTGSWRAGMSCGTQPRRPHRRRASEKTIFAKSRSSGARKRMVRALAGVLGACLKTQAMSRSFPGSAQRHVVPQRARDTRPKPILKQTLIASALYSAAWRDGPIIGPLLWADAVSVIAGLVTPILRSYPGA